MASSSSGHESVTTRAPVVPAWRDLWAWLSALSVLPLLLRSLGAPLGEPAAEDFDMLRRALLEHAHSLFDGGGSVAFWRPGAFQIYFAALGDLILTHPRLVAALHVALLAVGALLLYRVLRASWSGPMAAAAASFPLLAESTRTVIAWPSLFGDLGAFLFSMLALHEATRRRLWSALPALLAALLCKEVACVTAVLLPFVPGLASRPGGERRRWLLGSGAVLVIWAAAYSWVRARAGLELPHGLERDAALLATPLDQRFWWAGSNSLRAIFSLSARLGRWDWAAAGEIALFAAAVVLAFAFDRGARERVRRQVPWIAWGAAWFALAAAALVPIFPLWAPGRSQFASVGLGVAVVAALAATRPALVAALVAGRLGLLLLAAPAVSWITPEPEERGAFIDFARVTRLQRLMEATRHALRSRYPALPRGARVGFHSLPIAAEYAYGGAHAVQVWYRDTTLRWVPYADFRADSMQSVVTLIEYQPEPPDQVVLLDPDAVRGHLLGVSLLQQGRWSEALGTLSRADSAQRDRAARIFLGDLAGRRAYCLAALGRFDEADLEAHRALRASALDVGARFVIAADHVVKHERAAALAQLDTLLAMNPGYDDAVRLRAQLIGAARAESAGPPRTAAGGR